MPTKMEDDIRADSKWVPVSIKKDDAVIKIDMLPEQAHALATLLSRYARKTKGKTLGTVRLTFPVYGDEAALLVGYSYGHNGV
ncbi:MAG: hypothetical protein WA766_07870 [Candidatus Acidiferrales bacterium]